MANCKLTLACIICLLLTSIAYSQSDTVVDLNKKIIRIKEQNGLVKYYDTLGNCYTNPIVKKSFGKKKDDKIIDDISRYAIEFSDGDDNYFEANDTDFLYFYIFVMVSKNKIQSISVHGVNYLKPYYGRIINVIYNDLFALKNLGESKTVYEDTLIISCIRTLRVEKKPIYLRRDSIPK